MTAADELHAAAERLRRLAGAATAGPWAWRTDQPGQFQLVHPHQIAGFPVHPLNVLKANNAWPPTDADAAYIAAMHPGVGMALAEWLDDTARHVESTAAQNAEGAFTLARLINGGAS